MAWYPARGGGIPASVKTDMNAVLNKKFGTVGETYPPKEWADDVNLMGLLPIRTASGTIAHFEDGADDVPLKSLTAQIVPIQEGTGDPSPTNPRPISGTSVLNVTRTGANLLDISEGEIGKWIDGSGNETTALQGYVSEFIKTTGTTIKINVFGQGDVSFFSCSICEYDKDKNFIRRDHHATASLSSEISDTLSNTTAFVKFQIYLNGGMTQTALNNGDIMVSFDSATAYEAYKSETYTKALGQTVYAGELDVTTGEGSITHQMYDMSALSWNKNGSSPTFYSGIIQGITEQTADFYCTCYLPTVNGGYNAQNWKCSLRGETGQTRIWVCDNRFETSADFRASLTNQKIVLPKATPTEIALTPEEVNTFYGANNIWADTGDTEVEYRADIDLLLASLEGNRGLQMTRSTPPVEEEQTEEVEENEDER